MTKQEQRNLIAQRAGSELGPLSIAVLKELVTCNNLGRNCRDVDAEAKPFRVRTKKLQRKLGAKKVDTIAYHIRILENKELVTVTREKGKTNWYLLRLSPMKAWGDTGEANMLKKQKRDAAKARWAAKNREAVAKTMAETLTTDAVQEFFRKLAEDNQARANQFGSVFVEQV